jgi:hypothetical protein
MRQRSAPGSMRWTKPILGPRASYGLSMGRELGTRLGCGLDGDLPCHLLVRGRRGRQRLPVYYDYDGLAPPDCQSAFGLHV